jgi:branched-chain amino acid transport system ATP-binding protein
MKEQTMNPTANQDTVLNVSGISKKFGGLQALSDVGITIQRGQVYGLIGPNGAGKTTFFNVITGLYTPDSGTFELAGKPYQPTAVHEVAKAGIARTFQNIRLFAEMTALENVMVGRHVAPIRVCWGRFFARPASRPKRLRLPSVRKSCSTTWASANMPTTKPARCHMVTSVAWKSPAPWPLIRS